MIQEDECMGNYYPPSDKERVRQKITNNLRRDKTWFYMEKYRKGEPTRVFISGTDGGRMTGRIRSRPRGIGNGHSGSVWVIGPAPD